MTDRAAAPAPALTTLSQPELEEWLGAHGHKSYRAAQVNRWLYRRPADSFNGMTDLPAALRQDLAAGFRFTSVAPVSVAAADGGLTHKYLFRLDDGELLESVAMHYPRNTRSAERTTVCLSTQVGCAVRCPFCATGLAGLRRNLTAAEVVDQVLEVSRRELVEGRRVSHLVYMGMGEPLQNLEATLESARRFTSPAALGLGVRRVTISTSGVVPGIQALAAAGLGVNLAVSLHAPDDELRDRLVPINRKWPIRAVLAAADDYADRTGRRVSYEYVMLGGVNDAAARADQLGRLLRGRLAHVNLIPYNPIPGDPYRASAPRDIEAFRGRVRQHDIECTVRDTRGRDIAGACGQLRAEALDLAAAAARKT